MEVTQGQLPSPQLTAAERLFGALGAEAGFRDPPALTMCRPSPGQGRQPLGLRGLLPEEAAVFLGLGGLQKPPGVGRPGTKRMQRSRGRSAGVGVQSRPGVLGLPVWGPQSRPQVLLRGAPRHPGWPTGLGHLKSTVDFLYPSYLGVSLKIGGAAEQHQVMPTARCCSGYEIRRWCLA